MVPEKPRATAVHFTADKMILDLDDGREIGVPLEWFASLRDASPAARESYRLIGGGVGIHWPDLDEDLSVAALLMPPVHAKAAS
jgi:hypothetical protein